MSLASDVTAAAMTSLLLPANLCLSAPSERGDQLQAAQPRAAVWPPRWTTADRPPVSRRPMRRSSSRLARSEAWQRRLGLSQFGGAEPHRSSGRRDRYWHELTADWQKRARRPTLDYPEPHMKKLIIAAALLCGTSTQAFAAPCVSTTRNGLGGASALIRAH